MTLRFKFFVKILIKIQKEKKKKRCIVYLVVVTTSFFCPLDMGFETMIIQKM